ncbi:MAG: hypothetical protein P1V34_11285 [Alphaproteobacteria bacterium]|nr:hypothetical protein [Alphaproteobacteria bacterium]
MATTYLPNSFEERGVTVPFTSDPVRNARLRGEIAEEREFLLPSLSGGKGTYVVPFKALGATIDLNLYDQALIQHLTDAETFTPFDLRRLVLDVDAKGYGGVPKARAAKRALQNERKVVSYNQCLLILRALEVLSSKPVGLDVTALMTPEGQNLAKEQFKIYSVTWHTTSEELMQKFQLWANIIWAIGVKETDHPGYLAQTYTNIQVMIDDIKDHLTKEPPEVQVIGKGIIDAATLTREIALREIEVCWGYETDIADTLSHFEDAMRDMAARVQKVSWILDGWARLFETWKESEDSFRGERRKILERIYEGLPILPKVALAKRQVDILSGIRETQKSWVKANMDWRTEEMDQEMMQRLSAYEIVDV